MSDFSVQRSSSGGHGFPWWVIGLLLLGLIVGGILLTSSGNPVNPNQAEIDEALEVAEKQLKDAEDSLTKMGDDLADGITSDADDDLEFIEGIAKDLAHLPDRLRSMNADPAEIGAAEEDAKYAREILGEATDLHGLFP